MDTKMVKYDWEALKNEEFFEERFVIECFRKVAMEYLHNPKEVVYYFQNEGDLFVFRTAEEELDSISYDHFPFTITPREVENELHLIGELIK